MKIVLLKNIPKIGEKYDIKEVSSGYASNFLIPQKLAELATPSRIKELENLRSEREEKKEAQKSLLEGALDKLKGNTVEITTKANEEGHLFAGIHADEIAKVLSKQFGETLSPEHIKIKTPIKEVGEFAIEVGAGDSIQKITLKVIPA